MANVPPTPAGNGIHSWYYLNGSWTTARAGSGGFNEGDDSGNMWVAATWVISASQWVCEQSFLEFPTGSAGLTGTVVDALLEVTAITAQGTSSVRCRADSFAYPLDASDFVPGASLSSLALQDTVAVATAATTYQFSIDPGVVNLAGPTRLMLHEQSQESSTSPGTGSEDYCVFDPPGGTDEPVLIVTTDDGTVMAIRVGGVTPSGLYVGSTEVLAAYAGDTQVWG